MTEYGNIWTQGRNSKGIDARDLIKMPCGCYRIGDLKWCPEHGTPSVLPQHDPEAKHVHVDEKGVWHWCYHQCKNVITAWQFWLGVTVSFPVEHLIWEKIWPFYLLTDLLHHIEQWPW